MALADLLLCAKCDHPAHSHVHGRCSGEDGRPCPCGRFRSPSADKRELEQAGTTRVELAELAGKLERLAWIVENGGVLRTRWTRDVLREAASALRASAVADALRRHGVTADEVRGILRPAPDSPTEQGGAEARGDLGRGHHPDCRFESFNACRERWEAQGRDVGHLKPMDPRAGFVHCAPGCPHRERDEEHAKTLRSDPRPPSDSPEPRVQSGVGSTPESARPCGPAPANPTPREGRVDAVDLARRFHRHYERLAPRYGYETREESAVPWERVPEANASLMVETARCVLDELWPAPDSPTEQGGAEARVQSGVGSTPESARPCNPAPARKGQVVRADEAELVLALEQQAASYRDGTNGAPKPVAAWLRALADNIDPDMPDELFVDALRPDEPRTLEPAQPDQGSEQEQARVLRAEIAAVADRLRVALTHPTSDHGLARAVQGQLDTLNELASHPSTEPEQPTRADRGEG